MTYFSFYDRLFLIFLNDFLYYSCSEYNNYIQSLLLNVFILTFFYSTLLDIVVIFQIRMTTKSDFKLNKFVVLIFRSVRHEFTRYAIGGVIVAGKVLFHETVTFSSRKIYWFSHSCDSSL